MRGRGRGEGRVFSVGWEQGCVRGVLAEDYANSAAVILQWMRGVECEC